MNYYQELTILPNPEISPYFIWSKLFTQIHLALVEHAKATYGEDVIHGNIGISFPDYAFEKEIKGKSVTSLGRRLRVFAKSPQELEELNVNQWLEKLSDYIHIKSIKNIPSEHGFVTVSRARQIKNLDRIARRREKHQKISFEDAKANIIKNYAKMHGLDMQKAKRAYENPKLKAYPYINMQSLEGKQRFSLELKQTPVTEANIGKFNTYGLSATSTVPHWEEASTR